MPFAMLWKNKEGDSTLDWRKFQKIYCRQAMIKARMRTMFNEAVYGKDFSND